MSVRGKAAFELGVTTRKRVNYGNNAVLAKCSGYDPSDGSLRPELVTQKISTSTPTFTVDEGTPVIFRSGSLTEVATPCNDNKLRYSASGDITDGAQAGALTAIKESVPAKCGAQILFPTLAGVRAFEPDAPANKVRLLSLKSPVDYVSTAQPTVTQGTFPGVQLFDGTGWTAGAGVTKTEAATKLSLSLANTVTASEKLATYDMDADILLTGKSWLLLDISIANDVQQYSINGLFANDPSIRPSGYTINLYSDAGCTTLIQACRIPYLKLSGSVYRVAINLGALTSTVAGVAIATDAFWVFPAGTTAVILNVYAEAYNAANTYKGNFLLPSPTYLDAPLYSALTLDTGQVKQTTIDATNLITNGAFDAGTSGWTLSGGAYIATHGRNGLGSVNLPNYSFDQSFHPFNRMMQTVSLSANKTYTLSWWMFSHQSHWDDKGNGQVYVRIEWGNNTILYLPSGETVADASQLDPTDATARTAMWNTVRTKQVPWSDSWQQFSCTFAVPTGVSTADISICSCPLPDAWYVGDVQQPIGDYFLVDDVSLILSNYTGQGTTIEVMHMSETGSDVTPDLDKVKYSYVFAGKPLTGGTITQLMYSNPSTESVALVANPWCIPQINVTVPVDANSASVLTEYPSNVSHIVVYRSMYDGLSKTWSTWIPVGVTGVGATVGLSDSLTDDTKPLTLLGFPIPQEMEIVNDYAPSARYVCVSDRRVYLACLNYDSTKTKWVSPTAIQVSSYDKPWAYPAIYDEYSLPGDGEYLDGYAQTGTEIRGIVTFNEDRIVFLDNELFLLRGNSASQGWRFSRIDAIGCVSARSIANCRSSVIWHDGNQFYRWGMGQGVDAISRFDIDSTLITWTSPHNAVYAKDKYILFCYYNGHQALIIYDLQTGGWRIRESLALDEVKGICTNGTTVYGITDAGFLFNIFGSLAEHAGHTTVRDVNTQYQLLAEPGSDIHISQAVLEIETAESAGVDVQVTFYWTGAINANTSSTILTQHISPTVMRYYPKLNIDCNALACNIQYTGATPPTIHFIGVQVDDEAIAR